MSERNDEDRWLDQTYRQTSNESPPTASDDAILAEARRAAHRQQHKSIYRWQSLASVAAVMVISVYLVMDVQQTRKREEGDFYMPADQLQVQPDPQPSPEPSVQEAETSAPVKAKKQSAAELSSAEEMPQESAVLERSKPEALTQPSIASMPKRAETDVMSDTAGDATEEDKRHSAKGVVIDQAEPKSPDQLLQAIEEKLANDAEQEAQLLYQQLRRDYPDFEVPQALLQQMDDSE